MAARIPKIFCEPVAGYDPWRDSKGCTFDLRTAKRAINFYERHLRHVKGELAGQPFRLERWQKQLVGHTFGWQRRDGTRRYRKVFLYIPRKNGKTTLGAGLVLICLYVDGEPGAEIYSAAADRNQAALVYEQAQGMVLADPVLAESSKIYRSFKSIECGDSIYRVVSSDANTKHGYNPHCYCVDEVHAQRDAELMEVLETGTGARRQPLGIFLTTADYARPSACNEMLEYAERVRDGVLDDPSFFPVLYRADLSDDWTSEAVWRKANPCYGVSLKPAYMREQCRKAQDSPSFENTFKRLHLNIQTEQENRWLPMEDWRACDPEPWDRAELLGQECFAGLDLATTTDIAALVLWFPGSNRVLGRYWVPEATADARIEYLPWVRSGHMVTTPGNVTDYAFIRREINRIARDYKLLDIAYDPYNSSQLMIELTEQDGLPCTEFRQGFLSMNSPSKLLEKLVLQHALHHGADPVLAWMASNAAIKEDAAGNIKPVKPARSSARKIDGIVALVMALGRAQVREAPKSSVYVEREMLVL